MSEKKSVILVTEGLGYIGSHTVVELMEQGYESIIVDDLSNSEIRVLDNIEKIAGMKPQFYQSNLCDKQELRTLFENQPIEGVIHLAASKAVAESVVKPYAYYRNDTLCVLNLLEVMGKFQVSDMVFSSSCTVYGQPETLPVTEATPFKKAESPYGNTKQICEEIITDGVGANPDLKAISLSYFNPIGAHSSALLGEKSKGIPNNLLPLIMQTVTSIREKLRVFEDDYDTENGSTVRDYIYVVDLAKAHLSTLERLKWRDRNAAYESFNIGTGVGYSVLEIISGFERFNQVKVNYEIVERRFGDIENIGADTSLANEKLGWKAELGIEEMLTTAWNWQKSLPIVDVGAYASIKF